MVLTSQGRGMLSCNCLKDMCSGKLTYHGETVKIESLFTVDAETCLIIHRAIASFSSM